MNWLGHMVQPYVHKTDIVLDLGCGIMQALTDISGKGNLRCKAILGVDIHPEYLQAISTRYPTLRTSVNQTENFVDKSFDVVLCLDILEHLEKNEALSLLQETERIARKFVLVYTPTQFHTNEENILNAWGMGKNELQRHRCLLTPQELEKHGFQIKICNVDSPPCAFGVKQLQKERKNNQFDFWKKCFHRISLNS